MNTLITHRACGTPIFVVIGGIKSGDAVTVKNWQPVGDWPQPQKGDMTICPACREGFVLADTELIRKDVDVPPETL